MLINHYLIYILIARLKADYNTIKISLNLEKSYHKGNFLCYNCIHVHM